MNIYLTFLAVQHARRMFEGGVDLGESCERLSKMYGVPASTIARLAGRAVEECRQAKRAVITATAPPE